MVTGVSYASHNSHVTKKPPCTLSNFSQYEVNGNFNASIRRGRYYDPRKSIFRNRSLHPSQDCLHILRGERPGSRGELLISAGGQELERLFESANDPQLSNGN